MKTLELPQTDLTASDVVVGLMRINAMSDAEYEKMDQEWAQLILELVREKMPEIGNQTSQSIVVQVEKNEDGYYSIVSDDFSKLHDLILDYSGTEA